VFYSLIDGTLRITGIGGVSSLCSLQAMRGLNVLFGLLNFYLFYVLVDKLYLFRPAPTSHLASHHHHYRGHMRHTLMALLPHLFPVQFFFYFLYYTDAASTFFVFLCYYLSLCNRTTLSALVCVCARCSMDHPFLFKIESLVVFVLLSDWLCCCGLSSDKHRVDMLCCLSQRSEPILQVP